jgi:uncharacterized damage-inducible protein DinB
MSIFSNNKATAREEAAQYTEALLGLIGERDPLEILRTSPDVVAQQISGVDAALLSQPERPGKWSVRHVLAHLADSDVVWGWRLRLIIAEDKPAITGYDQDLWADNLHYGDVDPARSLEVYRVLRRWNLRLVENAAPDVLARYGVHSERGQESVAHLIRMYAGHDVLHQRQIARILDAVR